MEDDIEKTHVLDTYNTISSEFDKTRISVWECVKRFVSSLNKTSIVLDAGCGNGKNIKFMIKNGFTNVKGCDFTPNFVSLCKRQCFDVDEANVLCLPYESNSFDHVMCIAVVHHFSTDERRFTAINELFRVVKKGGSILITVCSQEEPFYKFKTNFRENEQDSLIPWNTSIGKQIGDRFYHMFVKGELERLCSRLPYAHIESFFEHKNWGIIITK